MKAYYWLIYPGMTLLLIVVSANFLVAGQNQTWFKLLTQHQKIVTDRETIARLQEKLTALDQVNQNGLVADLAWLDQVVPRKKQIDVLVNELQFAGQSSGAVLSSYKGTVGQISGPTASPSAGTAGTGDLTLKADYIVPDFNTAQKLLTTLENSFPLVKVSTADFTGTTLALTVVSSWRPEAPLSGATDTPLPTYAPTLQQLRTQLASYQIPLVIDLTSVAASTSGVPTGAVNPFTALPK